MCGKLELKNYVALSEAYLCLPFSVPLPPPSTASYPIIARLTTKDNLGSRISSLDRAFLKITSNINQQMHLYNFHLKHIKLLRHVSIFSDHHQGVSSFLSKVITYSRFGSFFVNKVLWQHIMLRRNLL